MRRVFALVIVFGFVFSLGMATTSANPLPAKKFKNCSDLWKTYPNGVARSVSASVRAAIDGYAQPSARPKIYRQNRNLDTGGQGVACGRQIDGAGLEDMFDRITCRDLARIYTREQMPAYCARFGY
jgi:hypothetical protein